MDSSLSSWIVVIFLIKNLMFTNTYQTRLNTYTCAKYIGNKCLYYRSYIYNIGRQAPIPQLPRNATLPILVRTTVGPNGPLRGPHYDPNIGFEPYWPGGDWVFRTTTSNPNITQTGSMCGEECSRIYKRYGVICGRNKNRLTQTFPNYCVMRDLDCRNVFGWYIAHRGPCRPSLPLYYSYPSSTGTPFLAIVNASNILADFSKRYYYLYNLTPPSNTTKQQG